MNYIIAKMDSSLKKEQIALECGQSVKSHIAMFNNKQRYDENMGWDSGLNSVCQYKNFNYSNARCFETYLKKNVHNTGHPPSALSIYYLSQEPDFDSWYNIVTATKLGVYCQYGTKYGHFDGLLELHKTWDSTNYIKEPSVEEKIQNTINIIVDNELSITHHTCAKLLISIYQFRFKCASIKHNIWYEFKNHKWIQMENAYVLRNLITETLEPFFANKKKMLSTEKGAYYKIDHIERIIKSLHNNAFKTGIINEYATLAYDPNFLTKLDENPNLLCFKNGVYELNTGIFRDGTPDDYISLSTNRSYKIPDAQVLREINAYLDQIQPNPKNKSYMMTALSTCLSGLITEGNFYILTGEGGAGKSIFMQLFKLAMGELFTPMDVRLLMEKRSKSTSNPSMADKKGVRACAFDEPTATDDINTDFIHSLIDKDELNIRHRSLFREETYFKSQMKLFLLCNKYPMILQNDSVWDKVKVISFNSKFIPSCRLKVGQKLLENQFIADLRLNEKFREWADPFMYMLLEAHKEYLIHGLVEPEEVTKATNTYRQQCNIYENCMTDSLDTTSDIQNKIPLIISDLNVNVVELLSSQMKSNKISKIHISNGKTIVEYDF